MVSAWPWLDLPGLRLSEPAEAPLTGSTHRGRKSSTQSRAAWDFLGRGAMRPLPLVGESAESRFAHADDSALRSLPVPGSLLLPQPLPLYPFATALTLRSSRTSLTAPTAMGTIFAESERSCSHDKSSDPCPHQLSHVCIRCLQASCLVQKRKDDRGTKAKQLEVTWWWRYASATPALWLPSWLRIFLRCGPPIQRRHVAVSWRCNRSADRVSGNPCRQYRGRRRWQPDGAHRRKFR